MRCEDWGGGPWKSVRRRAVHPSTNTALAKVHCHFRDSYHIATVALQIILTMFHLSPLLAKNLSANNPLRLAHAP